MKTQATHFKRFGTEPNGMATAYVKVIGSHVSYIPCGYVEIQEVDYRYYSKDGLIEL